MPQIDEEPNLNRFQNQVKNKEEQEISNFDRNAAMKLYEDNSHESLLSSELKMKARMRDSVKNSTTNKSQDSVGGDRKSGHSITENVRQIENLLYSDKGDASRKRLSDVEATNSSKWRQS